MVLCETVSEVLDPEIGLQCPQCSSMVHRWAQRSCWACCGYLASGVGGVLRASYRIS
jgi:hypothetical protein